MKCSTIRRPYEGNPCLVMLLYDVTFCKLTLHFTVVANAKHDLYQISFQIFVHINAFNMHVVPHAVAYLFICTTQMKPLISICCVKIEFPQTFDEFSKLV